jgi:hypothetical protein
VFQIERADGIAYHLHYHKKGRLDDPTKTRHTMTLENAAPALQQANIHRRQFTEHDYNSALQPVVLDESFITGPPVGRREVGMACINLLEACAAVAGLDGPGAAVDVTDELAFPWRRWLLNATNGPEARQGHIVKVFICCCLEADQGTEPCIACCRADRTYVCIYPSRELHAGRALTLKVHNDWPAEPLFHRPFFVAIPWNRL